MDVKGTPNFGSSARDAPCVVFAEIALFIRLLLISWNRIAVAELLATKPREMSAIALQCPPDFLRGKSVRPSSLVRLRWAPTVARFPAGHQRWNRKCRAVHR